MQELKLSFVNVGYGEAMLLECPDPARQDGTFVMLVDGGSADASEFADRSSGRVPLWEYLESQGPGHIDLMVNTHPHEDHVSGMLPAAELCPPRELWQTLDPAFVRGSMYQLDTAAARDLSQRKFMQGLNDCANLCRVVEDNGGAVRAMGPGASGALCEGLRYRVLGPGEEQLRELRRRSAELYDGTEGEDFLRRLSVLDAAMNNYSLILLLEYQGTRLLLPGDTNRAGYGGIDPALLRAELFKVGHHGQRDGADEALISAVRPKAVVCCASSDRRYHSADSTLLRMIEAQGAALYFSDCPPTASAPVPPHRSLVFTVGAQGVSAGQYR